MINYRHIPLFPSYNTFNNATAQNQPECNDEVKAIDSMTSGKTDSSLSDKCESMSKFSSIFPCSLKLYYERTYPFLFDSCEGLGTRVLCCAMKRSFHDLFDHKIICIVKSNKFIYLF